MAESRSDPSDQSGLRRDTAPADHEPATTDSARSDPANLKPASGPGTTEPRGKAEWRVRLLTARRSVPERVRAAEAVALASGAIAAARGTTGPVCCYVPVADEPGSLAMLDALRDAGYDVLLPVVPGAPAGRTPSNRSSAAPLDWAPYRGASLLVEGAYRLLAPSGPRLGETAIATAGLVLVPALAVDRRGVRLGRGGGWYDRTLPLANPGTQLVAVVRDDEFVDSLPVERHDVLMTGVLTPGSGPRALQTRLD